MVFTVFVVVRRGRSGDFCHRSRRHRRAQRRRAFEQNQQPSAITRSKAHQRIARGGLHRDAGQAVGVGEGSIKEHFQGCSIQRLQRKSPRPREQSAVDGETWILGGRTNQQHRSGLDMRQQRVLLRFGKAVQLVDEQQRALAQRSGRSSLGDHGPQFRHATQHR